MSKVFVQMLPTFLEGTSLEGTTAVVMDVLRASTTIIHALGQGAQRVIPSLTVDEALTAANRLPASSRLLGGERHGARIAGFDLGNSPFEYAPEVVQGKTVVFTTTNGTRALMHCQHAAHVCIGAFVNRQAVVSSVREWGGDVHLVCAGTDGQLTAEDILFAGAMASDLLSAPSSEWVAGNVQAQMALDFFQARSRTVDLFREAFFGSLGAQNLVELGMQRDIDRCMQNDLFKCVPVWNAKTGDITLGE